MLALVRLIRGHSVHLVAPCFIEKSILNYSTIPQLSARMPHVTMALAKRPAMLNPCLVCGMLCAIMRMGFDYSGDAPGGAPG